VIRAFGLNDIGLLAGLQRDSAPLAIEHILTHPRGPLWIALTGPWPWAGLGIATYVLREKTPEGKQAGFIQLIRRAARPEADVLHISPALSAAGLDACALVWERLLTHSASAAASHGLQRIFASIPDGGPEETCLRGASFSLYARETIFRLAVAPGLKESLSFGLLPAASPPGFRPQVPQDGWALQRLYTRSTPQLVQHAEGAITGDVGSPTLSWWEPDRWAGLVLEPAGEVRGAVQVHFGRAGHWMRVWGANVLTIRELRSLVAEGLRAIAKATEKGRPSPVYFTVRDYEGGVASILAGFGFAPYTDRVRFVRHIGARERKPLPVTLPAVEMPQALTQSSADPGMTAVRPYASGVGEGIPFSRS